MSDTSLPVDINLDHLEAPRKRDLRLPLVILLTILLALYFWSQSRFPALAEKALMGEDTPLSGLAFDIAIEIQPDDGFWQRLWANTVNWIATNIKGMSFGVLFGAMALTLLSLLQKRSFKNGFANSALGAIIGAPLGVCVNCAVPIALGLHAGRLRLETTLSAMLASPTLNVIVVTMSFALLPLHVAAVKLFASLMMVLVGVPLLCRFVLKEEAEATHAGRLTPQTDEQKLTGFSGWLMRNLAPRDYVGGTFGPRRTGLWFVKNYGRNFGFIFLVTVPMMFLAAFLGALFVEVFSVNELKHILPTRGAIMILIGIIGLAILASFAPAPIALDVILTAIAISVGLRDHYAAALVISLGSFSVYAFLIIWRAISLRTALSLWGMVVAAAVCAGCAAVVLSGPANRYKIDGYQRMLAEGNGIAWKDVITPEAAYPAEPSPAVQILPVPYSQDGDALIESVQLRAMKPAKATADGPVFTRVNGRDIGIDLEDNVTGLVRFLAYGILGGVAAGDFDGDGWTDLAFRQSQFAGGVGIFRNEGGTFRRYPIDLGELSDVPAFAVAFADLDEDSALDLVIATSGAGNYIFFNRGGKFAIADAVKLPGEDLAHTRSMAFADFDRDGRLDIVLGNTAIPLRMAGFPSKQVDITHNQLLLNRGDATFDDVRVSRYAGQTLTLLASDFDRNGTIDLLTGDDIANTDAFAMFAADGQFRFANAGDSPFPYRTMSSMGYEEGDWNNDLVPDYYGVQVAEEPLDETSAARDGRLHAICKQFGKDMQWQAENVQACLEGLRAQAVLKGAYRSGLQSGCELTKSDEIRQICAAQAMFYFYHSRRSDAPDTALYEECMRSIRKLPLLEPSCNSLLLSLKGGPRRAELEQDLGPLKSQANVFFQGGADGGFTDIAEAQGLLLPGWSWDSKFADLDQDGWQDLFVLTGWWGRAPDAQSNRFYRNLGGKFAERTTEFGLTDVIPSFSSVRLDYDRDGDIDIIRALSGPNIVVHKNERPAGKALWVHLRQKGGNTSAIGARVTICVDGATKVEPGLCQTRPIKASGGFASFDPIAAHFGLGSASLVSLVQVIWPDGKKSNVVPKGLSHGEIVVTRSGTR